MNNKKFYFRDLCRMCDGNEIIKIVSLSPTPPGNDFLEIEELGREEKVYPLDLYYCKACNHVQLGHVVDPKIIYQKNYTYVSATSGQFVKHLQEYAEDMVKRFNLKSNSLVVDIGSNDGTCLSFFKAFDMEVVGVDPAIDIAKKATENGIETIADFFSYELAIELKKNMGLQTTSLHIMPAHILTTCWM